MKYIFLISVLTGLLFQHFSQYVIMLEYRIQKNYIANVLCENKDKPEMHCDGKCYLRRQLAKDEQQQQQNTTSKEKYEVSFVNALETYNLQPLAPSTLLIVYYQDPVPYTPFNSIFHPPQA